MMAAAAILVVAAVTILGVFLLREPKLVLSNAETGRVYARLPLADGDSFSVKPEKKEDWVDKWVEKKKKDK